MAPKPDAFLSYTRFDNDFSGGAISMFRDQLAAHVRALTGKPFNIFQDVDGIGLGEHWPKKLDDMLNQTRFFMPILTPSFFASEPCRSELESFLDAEAKAGRTDLILPIYWTECELLDEETLRSEDPLAVILHERQHHDWQPLVFEAFTNTEVQKSLRALARKIRTAKRRVIHVVAENQEVAAGGGSRAQVQLVEPETAPPICRIRPDQYRRRNHQIIKPPPPTRQHLLRYRRVLVPGDGGHPAWRLQHGLAQG